VIFRRENEASWVIGFKGALCGSKAANPPQVNRSFADASAGSAARQLILTLCRPFRSRDFRRRECARNGGFTAHSIVVTY
jgi:hypothetical protein